MWRRPEKLWIVERLGRVLPAQTGMLLGAVAFVSSLSPSLIPRAGLLQGALAGLAFAIAYGLAVAVESAWKWLGLPLLPTRLRRRTLPASLLLTAMILVFGLSQATGWQNAIHDAMKMPPVESARPFTIAGAATIVILLLLGIARAFRWLSSSLTAWLKIYLPKKIAIASGIFGTALFFWAIGDGILLTAGLHVLDNSYQKIDRLLPSGVSQPTATESTGSPASLIAWEGLGAQGIDWIASRPGQREMVDLAGPAAMAPLRVYVGLNSADDVEARAALALAELKRVGAFDRAVLVIATPTGTGWVDPAGMLPVEILQRGDIASVAVQYSYLPSWLSLIVEPEYGAETARAVFEAVYGYWRDLPPERRPRLYLFGLSLGALNSDLSADFFDIIAAPYDGALWAGPPYASKTWKEVTRTRQPESPAWLPVFRDSTLFRFRNQVGTPVSPESPWGPVRIMYLQYASDPIVFFEWASFWRRPAWMDQPRGADVAPQLRWVPVVTGLQLMTDMMTATTVPAGVGHVYAAEDYLDGWLSVSAPQGWSEEGLAKLRSWLSQQGI